MLPASESNIEILKVDRKDYNVSLRSAGLAIPMGYQNTLTQRSGSNNGYRNVGPGDDTT